MENKNSTELNHVGDVRRRGVDSNAMTTLSHNDAQSLPFEMQDFESLPGPKPRPVVHAVEHIDADCKQFNARALYVTGLLSQAECSFLIELMGASDVETSDQRNKVRNVGRALFNTPELAHNLYARIEKIVAPLTLQYTEEQRIQSNTGELGPEHLSIEYGHDGTWNPVGLNECFRFCSYDIGGHFGAHCDGVYKRSSEEISIYTCMFYLNDDFEDGATRFLENGLVVHMAL